MNFIQHSEQGGLKRALVFLGGTVFAVSFALGSARALSAVREAVHAAGPSYAGNITLLERASPDISKPLGVAGAPAEGPASPLAEPDGDFYYTFNSPGTLYEAPRIEESSSPYWWLDSGGKLDVSNGIGRTIQGALAPLDRWRALYSLANPTDTEGGLYPQNLFRLVSKGFWEHPELEAHFRILSDHFSESPSRNASNGLLLMSRYQDGDTLYYAGIRVDGSAVIKKKYNGVYYTMAQEKVFPGLYHRNGQINFLPHGEWLSIRSATKTRSDGAVVVTLSLRREGNGAWVELASAVDDAGRFGGTPPITQAGRIGIRTDFMDVEFGDISVTSRGELRDD